MKYYNEQVIQMEGIYIAKQKKFWNNMIHSVMSFNEMWILLNIACL